MVQVLKKIISLQYLVIAGGGAGGAVFNSFCGGGGGAGGHLSASGFELFAGVPYTVTVGAGAAGSAGAGGTPCT